MSDAEGNGKLGAELEALLLSSFTDVARQRLPGVGKTQLVPELRKMRQAVLARLLKHPLGVGGFTTLETIAALGIEPAAFQTFATANAKQIPSSDRGYHLSPANMHLMLEAWNQVDKVVSWGHEYTGFLRLSTALAEAMQMPEVAAKQDCNPYLTVPEGHEWLYLTASQMQQFTNTSWKPRMQTISARNLSKCLPDPFAEKIGEGVVGSPTKWQITPFNAQLLGLRYDAAYTEVFKISPPQIKPIQLQLNAATVSVNPLEYFSRARVKDLVTRVHGILAQKSDSIAAAICPDDTQLGIYTVKMLEPLVGMQPINTQLVMGMMDRLNIIADDRTAARAAIETALGPHGQCQQYRRHHPLIPDLVFINRSDLSAVIADLSPLVDAPERQKPKDALVFRSQSNILHIAKSEYENWVRQKGIIPDHDRAAGVLYIRQLVDASSVEKLHSTYQRFIAHMQDQKLVLLGIIPMAIDYGVRFDNLFSECLKPLLEEQRLVDLVSTYLGRQFDQKNTCYAATRKTAKSVLEIVETYCKAHGPRRPVGPRKY